MPAEERGAGARRSKPQSRWLLRNTVRVCLPPGETFYDRHAPELPAQPNNFSPFAETVRRRRERELRGRGGSPPERRGRRAEAHW